MESLKHMVTLCFEVLLQRELDRGGIKPLNNAQLVI